ALDDNTDDNTYLKIVRETVPKLIHSQKPDLIFYLAGVDVLKTDKLGRLALTLDGCKTRDQIVFEEIQKNEIPVVFTMAAAIHSVLLQSLMHMLILLKRRGRFFFEPSHARILRGWHTLASRQTLRVEKRKISN